MEPLQLSNKLMMKKSSSAIRQQCLKPCSIAAFSFLNFVRSCDENEITIFQ